MEPSAAKRIPPPGGLSFTRPTSPAPSASWTTFSGRSDGSSSSTASFEACCMFKPPSLACRLAIQRLWKQDHSAPDLHVVTSGRHTHGSSLHVGSLLAQLTSNNALNTFRLRSISRSAVARSCLSWRPSSLRRFDPCSCSRAPRRNTNTGLPCCRSRKKNPAPPPGRAPTAVRAACVRPCAPRPARRCTAARARRRRGGRLHRRTHWRDRRRRGRHGTARRVR